MKYLVSIHHPAQVHFYRHIIDELRDRGHRVRVCVREKDVTVALLDAFDIPHVVLASSPDSTIGLPAVQLRYEWRLYREARRFEPDVMTSIGGIEISHIAPLVGAKSLAFDDTAARAARFLTLPGLDLVCTPTSFGPSDSPNRRTYDGYHELAYLHPARFEHRPDELRAYGVDPDSPYAVLRFASWEAYHDVGEHGLSRQAKRDLVALLDAHGDVYITSESPLPAEFRRYRLPVPAERVHDLLAAADLYVGDSGTMATEAAVLGTPAVRANSVVGSGDVPNFVELEETYELLYSFADEDEMHRRIESMLESPTLGETWARRRARLLGDKIDVTAYAVEQLERLGRNTRSDGRKSTESTLERLAGGVL